MNITKVNAGGVNYFIKDTISGYTSVEVGNLLQSGNEVGKITINGTTYTLYAPPASSEINLNVVVDNNSTNLNFIEG